MRSIGQQASQAAQLIARLRYQHMLHPSYWCSLFTADPEQSGGNSVTCSNGSERRRVLVLGALLSLWMRSQPKVGASFRAIAIKQPTPAWPMFVVVIMLLSLWYRVNTQTVKLFCGHKSMHPAMSMCYACGCLLNLIGVDPFICWCFHDNVF